MFIPYQAHRLHYGDIESLATHGSVHAMAIVSEILAITFKSSLLWLYFEAAAPT